jgi:hypothetical protein
MSDAAQDLIHSEEELRMAKERLSDTLGKIEHRLSPEGLADEAGRVVHVKVSGVGRKGAEIIRERPVALAAGASAIVALLAGRPIWRRLTSFLAKRRLTTAH